MAVAVQTVSMSGAGMSVVVLSWKVATVALSARDSNFRQPQTTDRP
jgi:hypothetical protein